MQNVLKYSRFSRILAKYQPKIMQPNISQNNIRWAKISLKIKLAALNRSSLEWLTGGAESVRVIDVEKASEIVQAVF